jgi:hypothetical protein
MSVVNVSLLSDYLVVVMVVVVMVVVVVVVDAF